eukprot:g15733.t1
MVFSLLEAARIEEEDMEDILLACSASASEEGGKRRRAAALQSLNEARRRNARELDALMAEYDPRPSRSCREHRLDKLRKALPRPEDALLVASDVDGGDDEGKGGGRSDEECFRGEANTYDHTGEPQKEGGGEGRREGDVTDDDGYYADDFAGGDRQDSSPVEAGRGQGGKQLPSHAADQSEDSDAVVYRAGAGGGRGAVDCQASGNKCRDGDGDNSSALGEGDALGHAAGGGGGGSTGGGEVFLLGKPTLPDPNEVNGSVMADPFNMDHIKDLPGLVGGGSRELSSLVRDTVSYIDPAFPNLEFHRRAAMDTAGYFMPGYKPQQCHFIAVDEIRR